MMKNTNTSVETLVTHTHFCKMCGEYEIGTFQVHDDFCSDVCADRAYDYVGEADFTKYDAAGDGWGYDDIQAMYDDDPNPYAGTYSED
jgi:hypothetical protein